jgi:hypothetical protein
MKKIYLGVLALAATLSFTACSNDKLDIPQRGVKTTEEYVTADDDEVVDMISAIYSKIHGNTFSWFMSKTMDSYASMQYELARMGGELAEHYQYNETAESNTYSMAWSYYYTVCYWCNMLINGLQNNNVASAATKTKITAEARTIRAIMMMNLVQLYGNPPLADHILTGKEGNTPAAESWAFIEKELAEAAEDLPSKSGVDGQAAIGGRLTKEAAYAYLGKAYLWAGDYNKAAEVLYDKVISTGKYALVSDYNSLNSSASDFCSENIWEYEITDKAGMEQSQDGVFDLALFGLPNGSINVPSVFRQSTCFGFGSTPSKEFGEFMETHEKTADGKLSQRYHGTLATYEELLSDYSYSGEKGVKQQVDNCQGYFRIKDQTLQADVMGGQYYAQQFTKKNTVFMRYSEVLLNYAEAVAMGGKPGALSGLEALNMVRRRAGLPDAPALDMNNATYGVKAEREAELFYEGDRFIDLVRWGDAATVLADCGTKDFKFNGYQNGDNATVQSKDQWKIVESPTVGKGFKKGKNELFPIPAVDRNNDPNLAQNPNW